MFSSEAVLALPVDDPMLCSQTAYSLDVSYVQINKTLDIHITQHTDTQTHHIRTHSHNVRACTHTQTHTYARQAQNNVPQGETRHRFEEGPGDVVQGENHRRLGHPGKPSARGKEGAGKSQNG